MGDWSGRFVAEVTTALTAAAVPD
ncbi:MAG: hypothetical protein QOE15_3190, partial [Acidimicrobiaceae bacterium]|nr:hypothetical protein [Acidimicrobiaceae bacterium]